MIADEGPEPGAQSRRSVVTARSARSVSSTSLPSRIALANAALDGGLAAGWLFLHPGQDRVGEAAPVGVAAARASSCSSGISGSSPGLPIRPTVTSLTSSQE